ncbi:MAG: head-tail connector protein [Limimaricola soesokkakensis]|uniref:head-tail connector protein n=1 Tax=Limimaricola soesokkakensis TaxID=1343159 RepID=UPI0040596B3D
MRLIETGAVPEAALPVEGFRAHLRIGTGFAEAGLQDAALAGFLRAAIAAIEGRTGKVLLARGFVLEVGRWRDARRLALPVAPLRVVTAFEIVDAQGTAVAVAPERWQAVMDDQRPHLLPVAAGWPGIPQGGTARIGFEAGYGAHWSEIPADLAQAVMMLAAHYHEYRHDTALGPGCMPFGVTALTERFRALRLSAGSGA